MAQALSVHFPPRQARRLRSARRRVKWGLARVHGRCDLVIGLGVEPERPDTYYTLATNLERAGFSQTEPSFRWTREVDGVRVVIELLGESADVEPGRSFRPRGQRTGSGLSLLNIPGANLAARDYIEVTVAQDRLDGGGRAEPVQAPGEGGP